MGKNIVDVESIEFDKRTNIWEKSRDNSKKFPLFTISSGKPREPEV